jgi:methylmalonyl-CoA/ethylmalonyl-CoA epimerase
MEVSGIHHVAMAVDDLDQAVATYERLFGAELELRDSLAEQGIEAAYLRVGSGRIELVAPTDGESAVGRFVASRGPGMHHVALAVPDVTLAVRELEEAGVTIIDTEPRAGLGGHEVSFVHPESIHGVLVEVVADE